MGSQSNLSIGSDKKNMIFVVILAIAIIISILFWKTETVGERLESAQFKLYGLRDNVDAKIIELDSLYAENKLITEQYQSLKKNYLNLQKVIVAKKKNLSSISSVSNRKEMANLLDDLNGQLLDYEVINDDLSNNTNSAVNNDKNAEILAENERIAKELRIAELNSQILVREKTALNNRVKELQEKLNSIASTTGENTEYLAELKTKFETEQQKFNRLKSETDEILKGKNDEIENLSKTAESIESLSKSSFKAVYQYKEGRRTQKTILLNTSDLHKSRFIKNVNISFVVPNIKDEKAAKLSVLKKDENGSFVAYRYKQIDIPLNDLKGNLSLDVDPKFDKGEYKFIVNYQLEEVFAHEFVIK